MAQLSIWPHVSGFTSLSLSLAMSASFPIYASCVPSEPRALMSQQMSKTPSTSSKEDLIELTGAAPITHTLEPGQRNKYRISLDSFHLLHNRLLEVAVEQQGIDVTVEAEDANGRRLAKVDYASGLWGTESLYLGRAMSGTEADEVIIVIEPRRSANIAGQYQIEVRQVQDATWAAWVDALERTEHVGPIALAEKLLNAQESFSLATDLQEGNNKDLTAAKKRYEDAALVYSQIGDTLKQASVAAHIADVDEDIPDPGRNSEALRKWEEAVELYRKSRDSYGEARALDRAAWLYSFQGDKLKSLNYHSQALQLFRLYSDSSAEAYALSEAGLLYEVMGDNKRAYSNFQEALVLHQRGHDTLGEGETLNNLGIYSLVVDDDSAQALKYFESALPLRGGQSARKGTNTRQHG